MRLIILTVLNVTGTGRIRCLPDACRCELWFVGCSPLEMLSHHAISAVSERRLVLPRHERHIGHKRHKVYKRHKRHTRHLSHRHTMSLAPACSNLLLLAPTCFCFCLLAPASYSSPPPGGFTGGRRLLPCSFVQSRQGFLTWLGLLDLADNFPHPCASPCQGSRKSLDRVVE